MSETKNQKDNPTPIGWAEESDVDEELHWVTDGEDVYIQRFICLNGLLFTPETAAEVGEKIQKLTDTDNTLYQYD